MLICNNLEECNSCDFSKWFNNGAFIQSNKFCETCQSILKSDCIKLVSDIQRFIIFNNQCQYLPGYYQDILQFHPICGDLLVVDGEDRDDGNYNPFDDLMDAIIVNLDVMIFVKNVYMGFAIYAYNDCYRIKNNCFGIY
ncbi:unnamed protein product [Paramecium pentaurelia]|uniref:Uncharacterized protein n=1 Tax=Paramecium pentaurelia TaxID=43138 RepID=A0A8S1YPM5_9CILI|nr:unnamed protein product [Paramecium pentaurelia]